MKARVHVPNAPLMRRAHQKMMKAAGTLNDMGIEIVAINICNYQPTISVQHCQANSQLFGSWAGRFFDGGKRYVRRDAKLHGCKITWIEQEAA